MSASGSSRTVLLTRPEGENQTLATLLSERFSDVRVCPMVTLTGLHVTPSMRKLAQDLDVIDKIFFVSKSAVRYSLPLLESFWPQWPAALSWFAVGEGTARELTAFDVRAAYPEQPGSEGLLALPALQQIHGDKVMIVRGQGGRALLASELEHRGATVSYLETYQRQKNSAADLSDLPRRAIIVVTSVEILEALLDQIGDQLRECFLVTASARIRDQALLAGLVQVFDAGGASDQALYDAIVGQVLNA